VPRSAPNPALAALFGPGAHHQGDLSFEGRVRVDGRFTGRLYTEELLEVGATGVIEGEADVARAVIAGRFTGRLRVREHLLLEPTARIEGALDIGVLELRAGARVSGELRVAGEELP
jgi:cytoskeletal protein CcmA (bactofilin family)